MPRLPRLDATEVAIGLLACLLPSGGFGVIFLCCLKLKVF